MSKLIKLNLLVKEIPGVVPSSIMTLQRILPGREWARDLYFALTYGRNLGWKHTRVKPASELKKYDILKQDISFLTITKNPYSWLLSLYRHSYHQYYKQKPDFEAFLRTPWKTVGRENCTRTLKNPMELWNIKNNSYLGLAEFDHLNITTESIIQDPKTVIDRIGSEFSIDKSSVQFVNYEESTKDKSKDFAYYQDYYLKEKWRDNLTKETISIINRSIDKNLMSYFGYETLT
jgi:hypothetical protein